jgi:uncharacterized protein (UPF0261 family)
LSNRSSNVVVIGTLDTKGPEIDYVATRLRELGLSTTVVDSGIMGTPGLQADVTREEVAIASGVTLLDVQKSGSRGAAVEHMQAGLAAIIRQLYARGRVQAVLCLGGAEGALLGASAMHQLPVGIPKVIVSPSASGRREFGPFMGASDVLVMHSVIDIAGLNAIARSVFDNATAAISGMVAWAGTGPTGDRPRVGITMLGQTTPGAAVLASDLEAAGYEPIIFHANGVGGPAMDQFARDGALHGVVDFTLSELANSPFDGIHATSADRMTAAVEAGIPLLVVPGAADFFNQGPPATVPEKYRDRKKYRHNPVATLVRVIEPEMADLGREIARRIRSATAPTAVLAPTRGFSLIGVAGEAIADPAADLALIDALEAELPLNIPLTRINMDVNDPAFGHLAARTFLELMARAAPPKGTST